ncbi:MAG: DUF5067 domain-containing protein [Clostridiales bacterium]|jgi:hypothetical protein|nr:DUF5067 domain-containing protein [Clostridiales bacterium]
MKRKIIALSMLAALCSAAFLAGCGEESQSSAVPAATSSSAETSSTPVSSTTESNTEPVMEGKGTLGNYGIEILGVNIGENYEGEKVAIVSFIFSNISSDEASSFGVYMNPKIYQDGVELAFSGPKESEKYKTDAQYSKVQKGGSLEVDYSVKLSNTTSPIQVEVSESSVFAGTGKVTKTLELPQE